MNIVPIRDSIIFEFAQVTRNGFFRNETDWGFMIAGEDYDAQKPRWGKVENIGPDVKNVSVGDYILIEPMKWTTSSEVDGKPLWRTAESQVMLVTGSKPKDIL